MKIKSNLKIIADAMKVLGYVKARIKEEDGKPPDESSSFLGQTIQENDRMRSTGTKCRPLTVSAVQVNLT